MKQIHGTNLGNWLVLEKWMSPELFEGTGTEDETWLARKLPADEFAAKLKQHRDTYVTEQDFQFIAESGLDTVRLPVTYGVFGDRPPLTGAIEYVDKAMDWAEKYGLKVLLDLQPLDHDGRVKATRIRQNYLFPLLAHVGSFLAGLPPGYMLFHEFVLLCLFCDGLCIAAGRWVVLVHWHEKTRQRRVLSSPLCL